MCLQRPKKKSLQKEKIELELPELADCGREFPPVVYLPHPLERERYVELIRSTDIGLLFYDSRVYYGRRAGVLGELLACGKPVIVPAGCWLANQIQEPIFKYADQCSGQRGIATA